MAEGLVHRILAPSFVDGPGSRMAVFLQGCDLACPTCHNPETRGTCDACGACLEACPRGALERQDTAILHHPARCEACGACEALCPRSATPRAQTMTPEDLLAQALPWVPFLDGLTFTGGECTRQPDFLRAAGRLLKAHTPWTWLVDTHGDLPEATFEALAEASDGFLFDLKALEPSMQARLTGRTLDRVVSNLHRMAALGRLVELRLLLIPGATAEPAALDALVGFVAGLPGAAPLRLQAYRHHGVRGEGLSLPELGPEALQWAVEHARKRLGAERVLTPPA